jgi:phthiocerol/phenolphthiocerol synthesis type-I polyketide synthase C
VSTALEHEIIEAMAELARIEPGSVDLETNLYDLGIDSLSSLEILVALEKRYGVRVSEESLADTSNVAEIVNAFVAAIRGKEESHEG